MTHKLWVICWTWPWYTLLGHHKIQFAFSIFDIWCNNRLLQQSAWPKNRINNCKTSCKVGCVFSMVILAKSRMGEKKAGDKWTRTKELNFYEILVNNIGWLGVSFEIQPKEAIPAYSVEFQMVCLLVFIWNSAGIFRLNFDVLLLLAEFQTKPLLDQGLCESDLVSYRIT